MLLGKIVGTVVATRKDPRLVSSKLLLARGIDPKGKAEGNYLVAIDTVDAGVGETVLIVSGSSARMASGLKDCPVDAAIVALIVIVTEAPFARLPFHVTVLVPTVATAVPLDALAVTSVRLAGRRSVNSSVGLSACVAGPALVRTTV